MNQTGNSINPGNIQHFADSAKNAIQLGQRQFFTPPDLAAALCTVFKGSAASIATDLMAGDLALLKAAKRPHSCGIDVDERVTTLPTRTAVFQADVTRFYPLAHQAMLRHDLLLLNPPFSLQWWLSRLAPLALSEVPGVPETYAAALAKGDTIDSTLATLLIALDSLSSNGEGFMICNADTARRLIGDPAPTDNGDSPLLRNIWCWLDIPGATYENQNSAFPTAVLYFSASHGRACPEDRRPLLLHSPSADPGTVAQTLATAVSARPFAMCGRSIVHEYQAQDWKERVQPVWNAVREEYHQLYHGAPPAFNLSLRPDGTIRSFLDPFIKDNMGSAGFKPNLKGPVHPDEPTSLQAAWKELAPHLMLATAKLMPLKRAALLIYFKNLGNSLHAQFATGQDHDDSLFDPSNPEPYIADLSDEDDDEDGDDPADSSTDNGQPTTDNPPENPDSPSDPSAFERLKSAHSTNRDGSLGSGPGGGPGSGYSSCDKRLKKIEELLDEMNPTEVNQDRWNTVEIILDYLNGDNTIAHVRKHLTAQPD